MELINNLEFAKNRMTLSGVINVNELLRANTVLDGLDGELSYKLSGGVNSKNRATMCIEIYGIITTLCQTCLSGLSLPINHVWSVAIFDNEAEEVHALFNEDEDCSDGVLADSNFDVMSFIEDEIIILLPISPRHEDCNNLSI